MIAIAFGTINVVGGFLVTDRMLEMFKRREARSRATRTTAAQATPRCGSTSLLLRTRTSSASTSSRSCCFILGLHQLNRPTTARRGNPIAAVGMADRRDCHAADPVGGQTTG